MDEKDRELEQAYIEALRNREAMKERLRAIPSGEKYPLSWEQDDMVAFDREVRGSS